MTEDKSTVSGSSRTGFLKADAVYSPRALAFYALGVALGLILGGIGLFNARGTVTNRVPPEDLAVVNQQPILRSDFITQLENETGKDFKDTTRQEQLQVLDEMLREELFVQRGLELNFAETDQNTRYALYDIVEQQITADVSISKTKDADLRKFFDANRDKFMTTGSMSVHHLVLAQDDRDKASRAAQDLRNGAPLDEVKKRYGLTEGQYFPDDQYYLAKVHLGDGLFEQVSKLNTGEVTDPIKQDDGFHIIDVVANDKPVPKSWEDAQSEVELVYADSEKARVMNNMMKFLRGRSTILIADDYKDDYDPDTFTGTN